MNKKSLLSAIAFAVCAAGLYAQQDHDSLAFANAGWHTKQLAEGVEWRYFHFKDKEKLFGDNQYVNILTVDQSKSATRFAVVAHPGELRRPSDMARESGALAAINGSYYDTKPPYGPLSYLKVDNIELMKPAGGAVFILIDDNGKLKVKYAIPNDTSDPSVVGSWPVLIWDGVKLNDATPDRASRTAVGSSGDKVFLLVVDGRSPKSAGMSMSELADIFKWLGAENALNLDGGGSTTMYVRGESDKGVVNHPSDTFLGFNHKGERRVGHSILLLDAPRTTVSK